MGGKIKIVFLRIIEYRILRILTPPPCQKISPKRAKGVRLRKKFKNFKN